MSNEIGVKETKEALLGLLKILPILLKQFKDGVQVAEDASALYEKIVKNEEIKAAILEAYDGYDKVPEEVKDISILEFFQLVGAVTPEVIKIIEEIKA